MAQPLPPQERCWCYDTELACAPRSEGYLLGDFVRCTYSSSSRVLSGGEREGRYDIPGTKHAVKTSYCEVLSPCTRRHGHGLLGEIRAKATQPGNHLCANASGQTNTTQHADALFLLCQVGLETVRCTAQHRTAHSLWTLQKDCIN